MLSCHLYTAIKDIYKYIYKYKYIIYKECSSRNEILTKIKFNYLLALHATKCQGCPSPWFNLISKLNTLVIY